MKKRLKEILLEYIKTFEEKHDFNCDSHVDEIVRDHFAIFCESLFVDMSDIFHDINTNQPEHLFMQWRNAVEAGAKINYISFCMGRRPKRALPTIINSVLIFTATDKYILQQKIR